MKASKVKTSTQKDGTWLVTASVDEIDYQSRFFSEPSQKEIFDAVKSFEDNYAELVHA